MTTVTVINIDRSVNFDIQNVFYKNEPVGFWSIGYQDEHSSLLTAMSPLSLGLVSNAGHQENLDDGKVRLDIKALEALWLDQELIPNDWKKLSEKEEFYIFFDGTILIDPDGIPMVACISWNGSYWDLWFDWVGAKRGPESFSAVYQGNL